MDLDWVEISGDERLRSQRRRPYDTAGSINPAPPFPTQPSGAPPPRSVMHDAMPAGHPATPQARETPRSQWAKLYSQRGRSCNYPDPLDLSFPLSSTPLGQPCPTHSTTTRSSSSVPPQVSVSTGELFGPGRANTLAGRALAEQILLNSKAKVVVTGRRKDRLAEFVDAHGKDGRVSSASVDVTDLKALPAVLEGYAVFAREIPPPDAL